MKCEKKRNAENGSKMLENLKIQKTLYVIKIFNVANEQILEKTISQNYLFQTMEHQLGFNPIYHVPFFKFCSAKFDVASSLVIVNIKGNFAIEIQILTVQFLFSLFERYL